MAQPTIPKAMRFGLDVADFIFNPTFKLITIPSGKIWSGLIINRIGGFNAGKTIKVFTKGNPTETTFELGIPDNRLLQPRGANVGVSGASLDILVQVDTPTTVSGSKTFTEMNAGFEFTTHVGVGGNRSRGVTVESNIYAQPPIIGST